MFYCVSNSTSSNHELSQKDWDSSLPGISSLCSLVVLATHCKATYKTPPEPHSTANNIFISSQHTGLSLGSQTGGEHIAMLTEKQDEIGWWGGQAVLWRSP